MARRDYKNLDLVDKTSEEYTKSVEELVALVRNTTSPQQKLEIDDNLTEFLMQANIKSGTIRKPAFLFYAAYYEWSEKEPEYSYVEFFIKFSRRFKSKRNKDGQYYLVNKESLSKYDSLSKEDFEKLKKETIELKSRKKDSRLHEED